MADQGIVPAAPATPAAPPPAAPAEASDVGSVRDWGEEAELVKLAYAETEGTVEEQTTEAKPEVAKPEEKKPEEEQTQTKLSKGFAKLAAEQDRFERRKVEENSKLQNVIAEIEKRETKVKPLEEAMQKAGNSPLEALQLLGYSYKDLVDYVMADGKIPPEKFAERLSQQQKLEVDAVRAELAELRNSREQERQAWEAQQEMGRNEHAVKSLLAEGSAGRQKYPTFAEKWAEDPKNAEMLMVDVNNALTTHFSQTGEKLDAERAVAYLEGILARMQVRPRNPGQPGAVPQTANAGAARQQAPTPFTPRDLSVTSMPSDEELSKMSQEELDALSLRMYNGG